VEGGPLGLRCSESLGQLRREGLTVGRCAVERLMRSVSLEGVVRGRRVRTTIPSDIAVERPPDLVQRVFRAEQPKVIGLFKTELIRHAVQWKGLDDVEMATLEWVWWCKHHRLLEPLGYLPPAGYEKQFAFSRAAPVAA
jgi:transposase InsO family protein